MEIKQKFTETRIKKYKSRFVHVKGYSWLGESKKRLRIDRMPTNDDLMEFANNIKIESNYIIQEIDKISRVILMIRDEDTMKWNAERIKEQNSIIRSKIDK